jgi:hypothetical protein
MSDDVKCFVAYPAAPPDRAESIEQAIQSIRAGKTVNIIGWRDLAPAGRLVISAICKAISDSNVFIADLTALNPNVLFELGYAIANRKRIWLILNPHIERAKTEFERFALLTTVGYLPYSSSQDIVNGFYSDRPFVDLDKILYDDLLESAGPPNKRDALLYIKPIVNTDAVIRIARRVDAGPIPSVIDEPAEMLAQPLPWYVKEVASSFAVVTHFLSTNHQGWELQNAKHALVAGLGFGLGKPLLMLAHDPYQSPLDYKDLLRTHGTAKNAEAIFDGWTTPLISEYDSLLNAVHVHQTQQRIRGELRSIFIGDPIAENESESVADYFVPTAAYTEALQSTHSIFIGRKGAGKTATLYKLSADLGADPRNHLCIVRPVDYELEGILTMLQQELSRSEKGYLVESFWKFLLYTEIARSIEERIGSKPEYLGRSQVEQELLDFVVNHAAAITPEFSARLEYAVDRLRGLRDYTGGEIRKSRISEMLHSELISKLRELLGRALSGKSKVIILVDNLDKAWNKDADVELLSELLFGLLSVSGRVAEDFKRSASGLKPIKLHFTLFLRSDIYAVMLHFARERDKLPVRRLTWDDPETLRAVVEERFVKSGAIKDSDGALWDRYFCRTVNGMPVQDYLVTIIFPRPRDLIFLVKSALHFAVNRRHSQIEEKDLLSGVKEYSRFAFNSFLAEVSALIPKAEDFLMHFVQAPEIITDHFIQEAMSKAGLPSQRLPEVVGILGDLTFLGFEVSPNRFEYIFDEQNSQKILVMAEKTKNKMDLSSQRFQIHPAFHGFLEVTSVLSSLVGQLPMDLQLD